MKINLFIVLTFSFCLRGYTPMDRWFSERPRKKNIIIIAGAKSHGPGYHEYIKTARLLKTMLDHSNVKNIETNIFLNDWPQDLSILIKADLIVFISDGKDGNFYTEAPFVAAERMRLLDEQMKRGCGFSLIHFSTFVSDSVGRKVLQWGGGYFDWQDEKGERSWYSSIMNLNAVVLPNLQSPITKGLRPFELNEEFYYNIRFDKGDTNVVSVLDVPALKGRDGKGNSVAWTIQRADGGRGFSTTMGHYFSNWQNASFRKLILNGLIWAAGIAVPENGVESSFFSNEQVIKYLYGAQGSALILTGENHPAHDWKTTTPLIESAIESGTKIHVDVSKNIEDLSQYDLKDYNFLVLNYCNWNNPKGLTDSSKVHFTKYLKEGGGLMIIHFANGAFHYSLPRAAASDWPEFRKICYAVWDHTSNSSHDNYGSFTVHIADNSHPVTAGITDYVTNDELYFNQKGEGNLKPLLTAHCNTTGKEEPLAWAYYYGRGKVFQTLLGHALPSYQNEGMRRLLKNAAQWLKKGEESK